MVDGDSAFVDRVEPGPILVIVAGVDHHQITLLSHAVDQQIIDDYYADLTARNFSPHTCASAIEISRPVNLKKCLRAIDVCDGLVMAVTDEEICDAKALIGAIAAFAAIVMGAAALAVLLVIATPVDASSPGCSR